jgi:hypothetical protein
MGLGSIVGGALSIGSALLGSSSSKKASKAQSKAAEAAIAEQRRQFDLSRGDLAPWREAGGQAIGQGFSMLQPGYDHTTSPGYQFRLDEGLRGVENSAAARGLLQSGGTLKGIERYAEGMAASDFNDHFNRMMSVASGGQQAATSGAQLGQQSAQNIGNLLTQQGNAKASGYMGQANAWSQGMGNLAQIFSGMGGNTGGGGWGF